MSYFRIEISNMYQKLEEIRINNEALVDNNAKLEMELKLKDAQLKYS